MKPVAVMISLLRTGCGAAPVLSPALQQPATDSAAADASAGTASSGVEVVAELEISDHADDGVVCRKEARLGSRIAVERCRPREPEHDNASLAEIERQELELMRQRQILRDQQRTMRELEQRRRALLPPRR